MGHTVTYINVYRTSSRAYTYKVLHVSWICIMVILLYMYAHVHDCITALLYKTSLQCMHLPQLGSFLTS